MEGAFKIAIVNGQNVVSARDLHVFLQVKTKFYDWFNRKVNEYGFLENVDYSKFNKVISTTRGNQNSVDYMITINMAKELSMVERTDQGKIARLYFIRCEQELKKKQQAAPSSSAVPVVAQPPADQSLDLMKSQLNLLNNIVTELKESRIEVQGIEKRVSDLEAKQQQNAPATTASYYTIAGYASLKKKRITKSLAMMLGRMAAQVCRQMRVIPGAVSDPRYGEVGTYPREVLEVVFEKYFR